jgi:hypothetical protein
MVTMIPHLFYVPGELAEQAIRRWPVETCAVLALLNVAMYGYVIVAMVKIRTAIRGYKGRG